MAQGANLDNSSFLSKAINKVINILGLNTEEWESIHDLFDSILNNNQLEDNVTFNDLDTDSLSFVQLSVELEHCLGEEIPQNWQEYTISALDSLYQKSKLA
jgi:acyl carrier protein